jgi:hypothetical protein
MATDLPDAVVAAGVADDDQVGSLDEFRHQWEREAGIVLNIIIIYTLTGAGVSPVA